jgi:benzoyl-CoA reductase subunit C
MEEVMQKLRAATESPYERLAKWKEQNGRKVVACSPMQFPEELIHAAGMLPMVLQETNEVVTGGFSYLYPFYCGITRNLVDIASKGQLDFLDGIFYNDICIQARTGGAILRQILKKAPVYLIRLPQVLDRPGTLESTLNEFRKIKARVEAIAGAKIDDKHLAASIETYNRNRSLLRELREMRTQSPGIMPYRDMLNAVQAGMVMPREEHNILLEKLIGKLKKAKAPAGKRKRVFLSGHLCQKPKADLVDLIEEAGGAIVDDDLYTGYRYYALDAQANGNPLEALARQYLDRSLPVPTRADKGERWEQYLARRAKETKASGVVVLMVKYCEPHLFRYPFIKESLAAARVPHLMLETEHEVVSLEGIKTRVQAFLEMIK